MKAKLTEKSTKLQLIPTCGMDLWNLGMAANAMSCLVKTTDGEIESVEFEIAHVVKKLTQRDR